METAISATGTEYVRRRSDVVAIAVGLVVLGAGMLAVRDGAVSGSRRRSSTPINDLPQALYPVLWPFQQLGVLVVGPIVALVAAILRQFRLAAAILVATVAKLDAGARRQGHRHPATAGHVDRSRRRISAGT